MPEVMGQPIVAWCLRASAARISLIVATLPRGTSLIKLSTSLGAGITTVPLPHRELIFGVIFSTLGRPLSSSSFSRHDLRVLILRLTSFAPQCADRNLNR